MCCESVRRPEHETETDRLVMTSKCVQLMSTPQYVFLCLCLIKHREIVVEKGNQLRNNWRVEILSLWRCGTMWAMTTSFLRFLDHTKRRTTVGGTPWTSDCFVTATPPRNSQQIQQTNIHVPGGIRTRNPSNRKAADPHLRPRGHRDWLLRYCGSFEVQVNCVLIELRVCCRLQF